MILIVELYGWYVDIESIAGVVFTVSSQARWCAVGFIADWTV